MPFRRRAFVREWMEKKTGEPMGSAGLLALIELLLEKIWSAVRILGIAVFVVFIISVAVQHQQGSLNQDVNAFSGRLTTFGNQLDRFEAQLNQTSVAIRDAREAAVESKKALEDALAQSRSGAVNAQAVLDALSAIHRIEVQLCGGPCPDIGGK